MDVKSVIEYLKVLLSDILLHFPTERKGVFPYLDF